MKDLGSSTESMGKEPIHIMVNKGITMMANG